MKRQKFIKALGAYGISRNAANRMAQITRKRGGTYETALAYFEQIYTRLWLAYRGDHKAAGYFAPYGGLLAANGYQDIGIDLSNGKDMTCIVPVMRTGDTVCCGRPLFSSKGVAAE